MLLLVDGKKVRADPLRELRRIRGACGEPRFDVDSERAVPNLGVGELARVNEVCHDARAELEDLLEERVARSARPVGSIRGDRRKFLGDECEKGRKDLGCLRMYVTVGRGRAIL